MGKFAKKTAYKKLLKEEKAKTKLKVSHKTVLPKGQNVTKTAFKVKKIVIKSQLREHEGEVVSKSNLNVKELISRLHHHNAPLRSNALASLSEIVNTNGDSVLNAHLPALLHAASNLILDREQEVRSEAIKLLSNILSKATDSQLSELFEIIVKHLACAMSHIDANIRESSLVMLDILIAKHPNLTAKHCQPVILPAFLDLISTKFADSERKLSLQFSDKMTTNIWRIKVLARLQALLNAIASIQMQPNSSNAELEYVKRIKWTDEKPIYASVYNCRFDPTQVVDLSKLQSEKNKTQLDQNNEIQNYTELLVPLLFDIFVEVAPQKTKSQRSVQHLSNEAAILLKFIADIILLIWRIFDSSDSAGFLKCWFSTKFASLALDHLLIGRFPYSLGENNQGLPSKFKKGKTGVVVSGVSPEYSKFLIDRECTYLNVTLSHIYLLLCKYSADSHEFTTVIQYITDLLPSCLRLDRETVTQLLNCADSIFSSDIQSRKYKFDVLHLVKVIKRLYDESSTKNDAHHNFVTEKIFGYLYKMTLAERTNVARNESELNNWLDSLPSLLTEKRVPYYMIKCIANIARCNIPAFNNGLDGYIESILDNLPHLEIISEHKGDKAEGKKLIANLLYFVQTWDEEFISGLKKALDGGYFAHLNAYIHDIMECKLSTC